MARTTGLLLTVSFAVMLAGALMFINRTGTDDAAPPASITYLSVERGLIATATVVTALGLVLLATTAPARPGILIWSGAVGYAAAAVVLVVAETRGLLTDHLPYTAVVVYVVVAFLSQVALGAGLLQTGYLSAWIGWATVVWNAAWLVTLTLASPDDIYFPVLHHVMPLVIGIDLLRPTDGPAHVLSPPWP